jgi:hypothetical protein
MRKLERRRLDPLGGANRPRSPTRIAHNVANIALVPPRLLLHHWILEWWKTVDSSGTARLYTF